MTLRNQLEVETEGDIASSRPKTTANISSEMGRRSSFWAERPEITAIESRESIADKILLDQVGRDCLFAK